MGRITELRKKMLTVEKIDFYALDLELWRAPVLPRLRLKVEFAFGGQEEIVRMAADGRLDLGGRSDFYLTKLRMGHRLLLGRRADEILFYLWVVDGQKILMNKVLALDPDEIAIERAFTRRDVRGHGLLVYALNELFAVEKGRGAARCLTEVSRKNRPMIATLSRYGFARLDSSYYWIAHPLRHHAVIVGPLRARSRPNTLISPMAGAQSRYLWRAGAKSRKPQSRIEE